MTPSLKIRPVLIILGGGFLFLLARALKWLSVGALAEPLTIKNFFGWQPFLNKNAAFSAPLPNILIILLAVPTLALVLFLMLQTMKHPEKNLSAAAYALILFGGLSNVLDRLIARATTDYLLFFTGITNLADLMIVGGLILLISIC